MKGTIKVIRAMRVRTSLPDVNVAIVCDGRKICDCTWVDVLMVRCVFLTNETVYNI
jgi:hypothetical protein